MTINKERIYSYEKIVMVLSLTLEEAKETVNITGAEKVFKESWSLTY